MLISCHEAKKKEFVHKTFTYSNNDWSQKNNNNFLLIQKWKERAVTLVTQLTNHYN